MKMNKTIAAAMLGLSIASMTNAGTVYVTGSTAGRAAAYLAFSTPGVIFSNTPSITTYGNASASGANWMVFEGGIAGIGATTISCHWSGSEGGVSDVASGASSTFVKPSAYNHAVNAANPVVADQESQPVTLAFADNPPSDAAIYGNNATPPADLTQVAPLGVIPFKWVRNNGLWTGTNLTSSMVRQALGGLCPRSVFTGVASQTDRVYVSGRDASSGTRVNEFAECGYGQFTTPAQIEVNSAGVMQILTGNGTLPSHYKGDFGYSSGGTLAGTLGSATTLSTDKARSPNTTGFSVIAFLGKSDSATAIAAGAVELAYNGVPYSNANIIEGTYTCWGTWHVMTKNSPDSSTQAVFNNLVANFESNIDGVNMIKLSDMHATKSSAGADVEHN